MDEKLTTRSEVTLRIGVDTLAKIMRNLAPYLGLESLELHHACFSRVTNSISSKILQRYFIDTQPCLY